MNILKRNQSKQHLNVDSRRWKSMPVEVAGLLALAIILSTVTIIAFAIILPAVALALGLCIVLVAVSLLSSLLTRRYWVLLFVLLILIIGIANYWTT